MAEKTKKILHTGVYSSPIGDISITEENGFIISVQLSKRETENTPSHLTDLAFKEILEYLNGTRTDFTVPIDPHGTDFQISGKFWSFQGKPHPATQLEMILILPYKTHMKAQSHYVILLSFNDQLFGFFSLLIIFHSHHLELAPEQC